MVQDLQVPEAQAVGPVHPIPPHCPYKGAAGPELVVVAAGVEEVVGVGLGPPEVEDGSWP